MKLDGIHHVTCITADAPANVRFYVGVLGLRLVKKSVNQDVPDIYHLFYADEDGSAGSDITFFEYPGMPRGRAGDGMVHRIIWRVASEASLDFWERRLSTHGATPRRLDGRLQFEDPEGLGLELAVVDVPDEPLRARHPEIPEEHALLGFDGVRAYASDPQASREVLESVLGFEPAGEATWTARGPRRGSFYAYDEPPSQRGLQGAGTVHHVAWASPMDEHEAWHRRVTEAGLRPTPIIDRFYFRSIYFREPSGVLFEIATLGPGFDVDEPKESLGQRLSLPPAFEHLRASVEGKLTPLPDPRAEAATRTR